MRWRQWIKEPPKAEDFPVFLAWDIAGQGVNIEHEVQVEVLQPDTFVQASTFWLPYSELLDTLPKELL